MVKNEEHWHFSDPGMLQRDNLKKNDNSVIFYYCTNIKGKDLKNAEVQKTMDSIDMHCINKKQTFLNII